ncbi:MarR family winged helix-turn-helix transcriptional regulator [Hahella ganghwensis]|uniref:MarR family winged helix-turn-helix transcriptional regulator n=1 Tax=Hahella ganghwensis TaxID=286420 RepID=UPI000380A010|nr:MarR family transcriptional regulator [Hahella ganghwensis]
MTSREKQLYAVFRQVRTCFNQLKTLAEDLHENHGVNPSMRAVIESLATGGPQTVPDIAKSKGVSRQHIQNIMNALHTDGFVEQSDNPAHKRSPLFDLTEKGNSVFKEIREKEKVPLKNLASELSLEELIHTEVSLEKINRQLETEISRGKKQ